MIEVHFDVKQDYNGLFGFIPKGSEERGFACFYGGIGLFHDVFEHFFEEKHKYFKGDFAYNVGGEMTAMGMAMYYHYVLGVHNRPIPNTYWQGNFSEAVMRTTFSEIQESVLEGYTNFGEELLCNVPYQKPCDYNMESMLSEFEYRISELEVRTSYEDERLAAIEYKKSVKGWKINRLHRYGYHWAERLIPYNKDNQIKLAEFIDFWDVFSKKITAEDLVKVVCEAKIKVIKRKSIVNWYCDLLTTWGQKVRVTDKTDIYSLQEKLNLW